MIRAVRVMVIQIQRSQDEKVKEQIVLHEFLEHYCQVVIGCAFELDAFFFKEVLTDVIHTVKDRVTSIEDLKLWVSKFKTSFHRIVKEAYKNKRSEERRKVTKQDLEYADTIMKKRQDLLQRHKTLEQRLYAEDAVETFKEGLEFQLNIFENQFHHRAFARDLPEILDNFSNGILAKDDHVFFQEVMRMAFKRQRIHSIDDFRQIVKDDAQGLNMCIQECMVQRSLEGLFTSEEKFRAKYEAFPSKFKGFRATNGNAIVDATQMVACKLHWVFKSGPDNLYFFKQEMQKAAASDAAKLPQQFLQNLLQHFEKFNVVEDYAKKSSITPARVGLWNTSIQRDVGIVLQMFKHRGIENFEVGFEAVQHALAAALPKIDAKNSAKILKAKFDELEKFHLTGSDDGLTILDQAIIEKEPFFTDFLRETLQAAGSGQDVHESVGFHEIEKFNTNDYF